MLRNKKKKKILLVEDEPHLVDMLRIRLQANGYDVICAYDGEEGIALAKKQKPDIILLDLLMPKIDGYQVCSHLKGTSRYAKIPIIVVTAKVHKPDQQKAMECGADAYIAKPFYPGDLLSTIREMLARKR